MENFSKYLLSLLEKYKKTRAELARDLGLKRQNYITNVLKGRHTPTVTRIKQIAKSLKCTPEEKVLLEKYALNEKNRSKTSFRNISYSFHNISYSFQASKINDLVHPPLVTNPLPKNPHLLDSLVFKIQGDFLKGFAEDGQKIIISYSAPLKEGDHAIIEFHCYEGNYTEKVTKFQKANGLFQKITIQSGLQPIPGIIDSINDKKIVLRGIKDKSSKLTILKKDITLKAKIMGVLF